MVCENNFGVITMKRITVLLLLLINSFILYAGENNIINDSQIRMQIENAGFGGDIDISYIGKINETYNVFYVSRYIENEYNVKVYNALVIFEDITLKGYFSGLNLKPVLNDTELIFSCSEEEGNKIVFDEGIPQKIHIDGEVFYFQFNGGK